MPAAVLAHAVGGGALPAPPWLLSYIGIAGMLLTVVALRSSWPTARLDRFSPDAAVDTTADEEGWPSIGQLLGIVLLGLSFVAAVIGPDDPAANVAPVAVLIVWWVGLPIASLVLGDVMGAINPFVGVVRLLRRIGVPGGSSPAAPPTWIPAAFLAAWGWFFLAYHHPGSPRALAVFLGAYVLVAVIAGLRWGAAWLRTGEGFGALSAAVARLAPRRGHRAVAGVATLMVVWVGGTLFDGLTNTPFWIDVLGTSRGWARTGLNTVGLAWMTAVAAGVLLVAFRLAERTSATTTEADDAPALVDRLGIALVPLATGWFIAHDLTLLLFEGQNFIALLSDPLGRGWDLFGTINRTIDYGIVQATWVRWVQLVALAVGHIGAVVVGHDIAIRLVGRRRGMAATWALAVTAAASLVAAVLLVLK
jgi:hypothetical protein